MTREFSDDRTSPISRPVTVSTLPSAGFALVIDAGEKECCALAKVHDLASVERFRADLELKRWRRDGVRIRGTIAAKIVQECVVTLQPVISELDVPVDAVFLPEGSKLTRPMDQDGALIIDPDGPDAPELFAGGEIDAGAVAEEFFELAIDPFPRVPGAELQRDAVAGDDRESGDDGKGNPFAKLAALRDKL
jgi:uncharacterized metal-binding protein YceD (DUF177 family)